MLPVVLLLVLLGPGHLACALFEPYFLARDAPRANELRTLLVLPANFDHTPKAELVRGTEIVEDKIVHYLSEAGFDVRQLHLSAVTEDWRASQKEVGGIKARRGRIDEKRYESARSSLVRRALERQPADAAIVPTLLLREASYRGFEASWDGVTREVSIDTGGTTRSVLLMRGKDLAISLRITVYDRSGRRVFERYAGLEPIARYETAQNHWKRAVRSDLFGDEEILDSGVRMAFAPWIEAPTAPPE